MNTWQVEVSREAEKVLKRQDRTQPQRLQAAIDELQEDPFPRLGRDIEPVQGVAALWRLRKGDWRILYTIDEDARTVYVVAVRPRGQAYKGL